MFPLKDWLYFAAALAIAGFVAFAVHHERSVGAAKVEAVRQAENAQRAAVAAAATASAAIETARRESAQAEVSHEADRFNAVASAAAHDAAAADVRLRDRLAAAGRRAATPDPTAAAPSASTDPTASVPYGVFTGVDDAAGQLATYSDQLRIALGACINSYAALTP